MADTLEQQLAVVAKILNGNSYVKEHISLAWIVHDNKPCVKIIYDEAPIKNIVEQMLVDVTYHVEYEHLKLHKQIVQPLRATLEK